MPLIPQVVYAIFLLVLWNDCFVLRVATKPNNLGLILGLSLGLGIPALLVLVIGAYCYLKQGKRSSRYEMEDQKKYIPLKTRGTKGGASDNLTRYIY